jgi:UDPglucose 6-dehydrogenase
MLLFYMKITVVGAGYVGLSLAVLISQKYEVIAFDISEEKVKKINKRNSPIHDLELIEYFQNKKLNLKATTDRNIAYREADYIIIATPTNYDVKTGSFDTSSVESVISECVEFSNEATLVIKSTIPIGFTDQMRKKFNTNNIFFSPEFLRESKALYDNLHPSRIVIGAYSEQSIKFGKLLIECAETNHKNIPLINMESKEAEAVKLFSNTYLAMRIAFFNELDSFNEIQNLSSERVIAGVSTDPRIGDYYNNPSFGYGGYCLPKDTKQLLSNFQKIPNKLITAVIEANQTRKDFIVNSIVNKSPKTVGVYRLIMKEGSDNFRESAVLDILQTLRNKKINIILYEPYMETKNLDNIVVYKNLNDFIKKSDLIIANRISDELKHIRNKVYSRDIFNEN